MLKGSFKRTFAVILCIAVIITQYTIMFADGEDTPLEENTSSEESSSATGESNNEDSSTSQSPEASNPSPIESEENSTQGGDPVSTPAAATETPIEIEINTGDGEGEDLNPSESDISINEGYATAIITSEITNALYEGEWQDGHPNGWGRLAIWNSAENSKKATVIIGNFSNGKMNGNMKLSSSDKEGVTLRVENGKIQAINRNEDGEIWNVENIESIAIDYIAGVPGFGGSDNKLMVRY